MPLYQIQVAKGRQRVDSRAIELPDSETAKRHAERLANGLTTLNSEFGVGRHLRDWHVRVTDKHGKMLARYEVQLALTPRFNFKLKPNCSANALPPRAIERR